VKTGRRGRRPKNSPDQEEIYDSLPSSEQAKQYGLDMEKIEEASDDEDAAGTEISILQNQIQHKKLYHSVHRLNSPH